MTIMHPSDGFQNNAPCCTLLQNSNHLKLDMDMHYILHKTVYFHTLYSTLFAGCIMFPMTVPLSGSNDVINVKNKFNRKDKI